MNNPIISVVMPVYNAEKYLSEAIESILNQTFRDFEFIVVYDRSQDRSLEIIKSYMEIDKRIKLIELDNKGLVYSLNTGIEVAKGKYIARMDADDISLPERLEVQYNYMEENPDITILGAFIEAFGADMRTHNSIQNWFNEKINYQNQYVKAANGCPIAHPTVLMKRDFAKLEKYSMDYSAMEDFELWVRAIKKGYNISNVDRVLLKYRVHTESKSNCEKNLIYLTMNYKLQTFYDISKSNVLIWGAGLGGRLFLDFLNISKWNEKIKVLGIIDTIKEGEIENIQIIKPKDIDNIKYDYIFITSTLGYYEISDYLSNKGLKAVEDYISIV